MPLAVAVFDTQIGRERFLAVSHEPWETFRTLWRLGDSGASREEQIHQLAEEARILDLVVRYVSSHDAKDLDWTLSLFTPDNDTSPDGVPRQQALADQYTTYNELTHNFSHHRIANLVVRLSDGGQEAWLTGYWHVSRTGYPGEVAARFGHYFWRVVKVDGQWKIGDRRNAGASVFESEFEDEGHLPDRPPPAPNRDLPPLGSASDFGGAGGRATFEGLAADWHSAEQWLWRQQVHADALTHLLNERRARELLSFQAYAVDAQDWNWLGSLFATDALLITNDARSTGKDEVLNAFARLQAGIQQSCLRYANPLLRTAPNGQEAWVTAQFHFSAKQVDERQRSTFGQVFGRLERAGTRWRIVDWRIFADATLALNPASGRSRELTMPDIPSERARFDLAVNGGAWAARKWLLDMPADESAEAQVQRLSDELGLRELLLRYVTTVGNWDIDRALEQFKENAVITTRAGRFRERERIRSYFQIQFASGDRSLERLMNTAVRLVPGGSQGWISTYVYSVQPDRLRAADGHLLGHAVKEDGVWKFVDLLVSVDGERIFPST